MNYIFKQSMCLKIFFIIQGNNGKHVQYIFLVRTLAI